MPDPFKTSTTSLVTLYTFGRRRCKRTFLKILCSCVFTGGWLLSVPYNDNRKESNKGCAFEEPKIPESTSGRDSTVAMQAFIEKIYSSTLFGFGIDHQTPNMHLRGDTIDNDGQGVFPAAAAEEGE